ncbi:MAG: LacI family DNA-binding transcriptional regulator [Eubacteriales bacterium]|nr:LacI family DNA-binding transcriptional regulator [Eubacteriales bacterium]
MTTIKDIAEHCHVGVSTVSRAINGHPDVSPGTRELIMDAIRKYHYIPNNSARNLVKTTSDTVALIVRGVGNPFFVRLIKVIEQEINRRGYTLTMHQIGSDADEVNTAALLATEKKLQGVLFLGGRFNYTEEELEAISVPYVMCTYTNTFGHLPKDTYSSVAIDDTKEAFRAVSHLIELGHSRIAVLIEDEKDGSISELRYRGYCEALAANNIPFDPSLVIRSGNFSMPGAYAATNRFLETGVEFTAMFAIADAMAIAAIKSLVEQGWRVPEDCSVIAIDGLELSSYTIPTLCTLEQPADAMAAESANQLADLMEGRAQNTHKLFATTLREGASTARLVQ